MKKAILILVLAVLAALAVVFSPLGEGSVQADDAGALYVNQTASSVKDGAVAEAKLWPNQDVTLGFAGSGVVEAVYVKEGDKVQKGDILAEISGAENYRQQYAEAELNLTAAQDELKSLNDNYPTEKADIQQRLIQAKKALDDANDDYADYDTPAYRTRLDNANQAYTDKWSEVEDAQDLVDNVSELEESSPRRISVEDDYKKTLQDYEDLKRAYSLLLNNKDAAKAAVTAAEAEVKNLERELEELAEGPKQIKLDIVNRKIAAAEAQKTAAEKNIETLQIIAPFDGTAVRVDITEGELAAASKPAIVLADGSAMIVKTVDLSETDMSGISLGKRVKVVFDAYPNDELTGTVTKITNWAGTYLGDVVFPVEVTLDTTNLPLLWGMTASVYF